MFDLFRSRDKAVRYLLTALLAMVALSMVTYLIPGYGGSPSGADDPVVAEIGGDPLTVRDVQLNLQAAMRSKQIPPELVQNLIPEFVNRMINERAMAYESERMGFEVSDLEMIQAIRTMIPQLFPGGTFVGSAAYAGFLQQQNLSVGEFEQNLRKQLQLSKLQRLALDGVIVTPAEVEREFRQRNDKIKLEYIAFAQDKLRSQVSATPAELQEAYNRDKANYQIAAKRGFDLIIVDQAKLEASVVVPEVDLRHAYDANKERYRTPERVHARHILLKTMDKPADEIPKIQAKTEALLKQIKGGADFAEIAKKNSEDPGSGAKGGDLDWVTRGQMVKVFEDTAFSLKPKEISGVIKTEYGFHIVQVLERQDAQLKPFEAVKDELAAERKKQQVFETMQLIADNARAQLVKTPQQAAQIAAQLKVQAVHVAKAGVGDQLPEVGVVGELENTLPSLNKGEVTPVILANNRLLVAVVTDVYPARQAELSEVESKVKESVLAQKVFQLMTSKGQAAFQQASAPNADLKKIGQSLGGEVKTTGAFDQNGAAEGIGSANALQEGFLKPVGGVFGPVQVADKIVVCKVVEKIPADLSKLSGERTALLEKLKSERARERQSLFEDGVVSRLIKAGKVKVHQDAIQRLITNYRS